ncbi:MAG: hypothetical protein ACFFAN_17080 [Promethearchaeota archaeon]
MSKKLLDIDTKSSTETQSLYAKKIKPTTRRKIDLIKDDKHLEIGNIIDSAIDLYYDYLSMDPKVLKLVEKYIPSFGTECKIFEESMRYLHKERKREKRKDLEWWCKAKDEMRMMLIGETDFNQLIAAAENPKENLDRPAKKNVAFDLIIWYTGKSIKDLELEEILSTIKRIWVIQNYFYNIDIKNVNNDQFLLTFKHQQNKRYSDYWLRYFTRFFESEDFPYKILVEGEFFEKTLIIKIKRGYKKEA